MNTDRAYSDSSIESFHNDSECSTPPNEEPDQFTVKRNSREELLQGDIKSKLVALIQRNIGFVTHKFVNELLLVLRSENHSTLPKSSRTLLGTLASKTDIKLMLCKNGTYSEYKYFGIAINLQYIIDPEEYEERDISLLINVDGAEILKKTKNHAWYILGMVYHTEYQSKPFIIGISYGTSKPLSPREFLDDLVKECNDLYSSGIHIQNTRFNFEVKGFCCDTLARVYLKQTKGPTGFCSCERCEVYGESVSTLNNNIVASNKGKRVFNEIDCPERTKVSFKNKTQPKHHHATEDSPLLDILGFDIIKNVLLDAMHLFCLGVSNNVLNTFVHGNRSNRIGVNNVVKLQDNLDAISNDIPDEFQRTKLDLGDLTNWKATQYRVFLVYCMGLYLKDILSSNKYKHMMLLFVACRVLSSTELAVNYASYAKELLRKFVSLMPSLYGKGSVVMNIHNLIHVADDVITMKASIFFFSAFAFENCNGFIKKLVKTSKDPVAQITKRVDELRKGKVPSLQNRYPLIFKTKKLSNLPLITILEEINHVKFLSEVILGSMVLTSSHPNNFVFLKDQTMMRISSLFINTVDENYPKNVQIKGTKYKILDDLFDYPLDSRKVGIMLVKRVRGRKITTIVENVECKCIITKVNDKAVAIKLLH